MRLSLKEFYQRVSQFHENPAVIEFVSTPRGNILLWMIVLILLSGRMRYFPLVPLMVLSQLRPTQRTLFMSLGGVILVFGSQLPKLGVDDPFVFMATAAVLLAFIFMIFRIAKSFAAFPAVVKRYPQITLHLLLWSVLLPIIFFSGIPDSVPVALKATITAVILMLPHLVWRLGYLLYSGKHGTLQNGRFRDHLFYCLPAFGGTNVPFGRGHEYLQSKKSDSGLDLSRSQLAGLKLLFLAWLWIIAREVFSLWFYGEAGHLTGISTESNFGLFRLKELISGSAPALSLPMAWTCLLVDMVDDTLDLAILGHLVIGCLRLFGFNVFRNTYKPLLATSIVDFWNRYYYYFKELLVEFFFFPVFLSFFKKQPRLRIFAAVMAAAFAGNFYYHAMQQLGLFLDLGFVDAFTQIRSYGFYAFLLGLGVVISMSREKACRGKIRPQHSAFMSSWITVRKIAGVWIFFSLVRIWDQPGTLFMDETRFFLSLFYIIF